MNWILHAAVRTEFAFDVLVTKLAHLLREKLAVRAEEAPVERDWWKKSGGCGAKRGD